MQHNGELSTLSEISAGKENNLDVIRFIAALLVIFSHSFPLASGDGVSDFLSDFTGGKLGLGGLAVSVFFVYGGFLIARSVTRVKTARKFFKARILRIFPALIFVTLVLAFVVGPIFTSLSVKEYFSSSQTYRYLLNCVFILQHDLPGVFASNQYGPVMNGVLWTLPVEFGCYVICFIMYKLGFLSKKKFPISVPIMAAGCFLVWYLSRYIPLAGSMIRPVLLFYVGMAAFVYQDKIRISLKAGIIMVIPMLVGWGFGLVNTALFLFLPYILFAIGFATKRNLSNFSKYGEFSYGIYLWGWPIEQIVCAIFGASTSWYIVTLIAIPGAILMGIISYYLVEKIALKLK